MAAVVGRRHYALSLFLLFFLVAGGLPSLRLRGDARELAEELTDEGAGEGLQLLLLDLVIVVRVDRPCLLYTSPSPRDATLSRMPSSA